MVALKYSTKLPDCVSRHHRSCLTNANVSICMME